MYGFSGYGTNAYGSERQSGLIVTAIKLGMRIVRNSYNVVVPLMLQFKNIIIEL
jgi:hypothetical protein